MKEVEKKAIHPAALAVLELTEEEDDIKDFAAWHQWITDGRPLLTEEAIILLENGEARRESLAQEIREGLQGRGLWSPDRASDLISAIFSAIDGVKSATTVDHAKQVVDVLTDKEREDLFCGYCTHCGRRDPGCQCWNDE